MKIMRKEAYLNLQRVKLLAGNQVLHILLPTILFLISWMIVSAAIVTNAVEYEASDVDKPPKLVRSMPPKYPPGAKRERLEGRVIVRCLITSKGKADKMEVVESDPEGIFDESAMKALKYYSFRPGVKGGEMVDTWVKVPFTFTPK
jgi:TonB family protein